LDENIAALWIWLKSSKSDDATNQCIQHKHKVANCKKHGKNIFWICWSPLSRHYKKWG